MILLKSGVLGRVHFHFYIFLVFFFQRIVNFLTVVSDAWLSFTLFLRTAESKSLDDRAVNVGRGNEVTCNIRVCVNIGVVLREGLRPEPLPVPRSSNLPSIYEVFYF